VGGVNDSFITQDRNEDFEVGQDEATISKGHWYLTCVIFQKCYWQMKNMDIIFPKIPLELMLVWTSQPGKLLKKSNMLKYFLKR